MSTEKGQKGFPNVYQYPYELLENYMANWIEVNRKFYENTIKAWGILVQQVL